MTVSRAMTVQELMDLLAALPEHTRTFDVYIAQTDGELVEMKHLMVDLDIRTVFLNWQLDLADYFLRKSEGSYDGTRAD